MLILTPSQLDDIARIVDGERQRHVRQIKMFFKLALHGGEAYFRAESDEEQRRNDETFTATLHHLFRILGSWHEGHPGLDVQKAVRRAMCNRRFGITGKKYFGLFRNHARAGDTICVFSGCHVPFLLRSRQENGICQLVGECYVHGIMSGEVMDMESVQLGTIKLS